MQEVVGSTPIGSTLFCDIIAGVADHLSSSVLFRKDRAPDTPVTLHSILLHYCWSGGSPVFLCSFQKRQGTRHTSYLAQYFVTLLLEWRNGIRVGLKNRCSQGRVGSSPTSSIFLSYIVNQISANG